MTDQNTKQKIGTKEKITWCPGCPNFMILESVKQAISELIEEKQAKQTDFAISTDIGCNSKIYDYLNLSGIYGLHGRALATAIGMKLGNPHLKVIAFQGDGGAYAEGISHLIHSFRYNADMTLILHDNQSFSLTTGQPTPTSQQGYISKSEPLGEPDKPINPVKLALASNATFIARANAMDIQGTKEIIKKAIQHKGFSFVEIAQKCLIFNLDMNSLDKLMYKIPDNQDIKKANELADEWDYNTSKTGHDKIPIGIIYQTKEKTLEEKWPQLKNLVDKRVTWQEKQKQ